MVTCGETNEDKNDTGLNCDTNDTAGDSATGPDCSAITHDVIVTGPNCSANTDDAGMDNSTHDESATGPNYNANTNADIDNTTHDESATGPNCSANTNADIDNTTHDASATGPNYSTNTDDADTYNATHNTSATYPNCDADIDADIDNATRGATGPNYDASSSGLDFKSSSDDYTSDDTDEEYLGEELSEGEEKDNKFFAKIEETYAEENIFAADDLEDMVKKEKVMLERNEKGYCRCRQRNKELYDSMMLTYTPYITVETLMQVNHPWYTQKNEVMNTSISAFAPKDKTYSMTKSLLARVSIAAGISIAGHKNFWNNVASELEFTFDDNFIS